MRTKQPRKQSDPLFSWAEGKDLAARFLEELSNTLDLDKTIGKLNISRQEAREILKGLVPRATPASVPKARAWSSADAEYSMYVDGASRGNPGKAGAGALLTAPDGTAIKRLKSYLGVTTNNVAEYRAVIEALRWIQTQPKTSRPLAVNFHSDSTLIVQQIKGDWKIKEAHLKQLVDQVHRLEKDLAVTYTAIPREQNFPADALVNQALDKC